MESNLNLDSALNSVKHDKFNKFNAISSKNSRGRKKDDYSKSGGRNLIKQASVAISELGRES